MKRFPRACIFVLLLASAGCAGARGAVVADEAKYPISLSPVLPDAKGDPLYLGEDLVPKGELRVSATKVGFLYSAVGLDLDVSDEVNERVEALGGVGVVGLEVVTESCALNWFFPLTVLPFWPGCQSYEVTGTVVTNKGTGGAPPTAGVNQ